MSETPAPSQRVVVITGAASGIGFATAELFRDAGDIVFGLDIQPTVPEGVTYVECNVGDRSSVDAAIAVCAAHGRIDVLANVAGIVQFGRFEQISDAEWDRVHAVDLKGPFMMMQAAMPYLKACRGNIVNVSSVAGNVAQPYATAYAAAKGGLTMLTKALALELSPDNIRVNAICPGTVDTPIVSHVASIFPDDLDPRVAGEQETLNMDSLTIEGDAESGMTVSDGTVTANVICGNVPTANATVYIIDGVLAGAK